MTSQKPTTVDEYIAAAPEAGIEKLVELRTLLQSVVPEAEEVLKWNQPVFQLDTILFAYSAHRNHLTFAPLGPALERYAEELTKYKMGKSSVQFPYSDPLPTELIKRLATYRKEEVVERGAKWKT